MRQTYTDFDVWIIDDGSNDGTGDFLDSYVKNHDCSGYRNKINFVSTDNKGVSSARNLGIQASQGEYIASDDEWLPDKLFKQMSFLKSNPEIPLVHGEEIWIRKGKRVNPKKMHKKFGGDIFIKCLALCLISPSATLLTRKLLNEVGLFDEELKVCEDYDLWLKITSLYEVGFITEPTIVKYGGHGDQLSAKFFAMDYWRIKSLNRIKNIRRLSQDREQEVDKMIKKKGQILLNGYIKHQNLKNYDEILNYINRI